MTTTTVVKPMTLKHTLDARRYLVLAVAAGVIAVALFLVATIGQVQAVIDLIAEQSQETAKLKSLEGKVVQLQAVTTPTIASQSELVNLLLPSQKPLLELLNTLNTVSTSAQISLDSFELSPGELSSQSAQVAEVPNVSGTGVLSVEFIASGTLGQLNQFMSTLEQTTPLITITELSLRSGLEQKAKIKTLEELLAEPYRAQLTIESAYFTQTVDAALDTQLPTISADQERILSDLAVFTTTITPPQTEIIGGGLQDLFGIQLPELEQK